MSVAYGYRNAASICAGFSIRSIASWYGLLENSSSWMSRFSMSSLMSSCLVIVSPSSNLLKTPYAIACTYIVLFPFSIACVCRAMMSFFFSFIKIVSWLVVNWGVKVSRQVCRCSCFDTANFTIGRGVLQ